MTLKEAIDLVEQSKLPFFCFDPEVVNLAVVYDQFMFLAKCAAVAHEFFANDFFGCIDSEFI